VAEEGPLSHVWPGSHESAATCELVHCYGGGSMNCLSITEAFFS
jgi:hypothetical protein